MTDDLATRERTKYETMWRIPAYRNYSPAERSLVDVLRLLALPLGARLIDFGCGTGRATATLQSLGYAVTGVDFADNCLDPDVSIPFVRANLWDLPEMSADGGLCCDVMEHIPTDQVDRVLANIARAVPKCVFTIAFHPDNFGRVIGEKLHLTVQNENWWTERLLKAWPCVSDHGNGLFLVGHRHD